MSATNTATATKAPVFHDYVTARDGYNEAAIPGAYIGRPVLVVARETVNAAIDREGDKVKGMRSAKEHGVAMFLAGAHLDTAADAIMLECRTFDASWQPTGDALMIPANAVDVYISRPADYAANGGKRTVYDAFRSAQRARLQRAYNVAKLEWDADEWARISARYTDEEVGIDADFAERHGMTRHQAYDGSLRAYVDAECTRVRPVTAKAPVAKRIVNTDASALAAFIVRPATAPSADAIKAARAAAKGL